MNDDLITTLSKLHTIESSDGQDYVQMYDVLETVRRYYAEKTAEWIKHPKFDTCKCSNCNYVVYGDAFNYLPEFKYCPNCGSRMKGENQ